jgi:predicted CoA-binding protein
MNEAIERFFSSTAYAVIGVSKDRHKFGNIVFRAMAERGFTVYPVHKQLPAVEEQKCYNRVTDLPDEVHSAVIVLHPHDAEQIVAECKSKGIENIWLQQGAESRESIEYARGNGLNLIHDQCILMFLEPVKSLHALHRWVKKITRTYPA